MTSDEPVRSFELSVDDAAGNTSTQPVKFAVDTTPPTAPYELETTDYDPDTGLATIDWTSAADPDVVEPVVPGSGLAEIEFSYRVNGGTWSAWSTTGEPIEVPVQAQTGVDPVRWTR